MGLLKAVVDELEEEARFAYAGLSDNDVFVDVPIAYDVVAANAIEPST